MGGTSFATPKPPVNIELFIYRYIGYFNDFKIYLGILAHILLY